MQGQGTSPPGAGFYYERLARARALPEAERSADVRQWLRLHEELEAALAALPELPASATEECPLVEPLGGDAALAALLHFIAAAFSESINIVDPLHHKAALERLAPQLPPFFRVWWEGNKVGSSRRALSQPMVGLLLASCAACSSSISERRN